MKANLLIMQNSLLQRISMEKTLPHWIVKIKHSLLFLVLSLAVGCLPLIALETAFPPGWVKLVQMLGFILLGILRLVQIKQRDFYYKNNGIADFSFSLQLSILLLIALGFFYFLINPDFVLLAVGSACAFILPHIVLQSWLSFSGIPQTEYGIWNKPVPDTREKTFIFFGGIPVRVKFSLTANDRNQKIFKSNCPLDKSIGDFFNQFILIQRNNNKLDIELLDEQDEPFGWKFYKVELWGFKITQLDPELTVSESGLKNRSTVMAKRVRLWEVADAED
jgi:hypothetical protein